MNKNKFEDSIWIRDFYKSLSNAIFLNNLDNDTARRQAFVLLDNLCERFLKNYLIKVVKIKEETLKKDGKLFFENLIKALKKNIHNSDEIFDRFLEYHATRNGLYHSPIYFSVSDEQFNSYLEDLKLICSKIEIRSFDENYIKEYDAIYNSIFEKENKIRKKQKDTIEALIKEEFKIPAETYEGDIFLCSIPRNTISAIDTLINFLEGSLNRKFQNNIKARILEIIEAIDNYEYHSFLVSFADSNTWLCFYKIFFYEKNQKVKCNRVLVQNIIDRNEDIIDFKTCRSKSPLLGTFDPLFTNERVILF